MLFEQGAPVSWYAQSITAYDLRHFNAKTGDPAFNTLWEALAILVALRLWQSKLHVGIRVEVRSDSLAAIRVMFKLASPDKRLNAVAREIALDLSQCVYSAEVFKHTPGVANTLADALSRLEAPQPKQFPKILMIVPRAHPQERHASFWRTSGAPT